MAKEDYDLVQLPRLNADEAVLLVRELLASAKLAYALPPPIERSRARLATALVDLEAELDSPPPTVDPTVRRRADRAIDGAWEATFEWLSGWCKLADEFNPHRSAARALFQLVFADALSFTKLPYKIEWAQSRARLEAIEREGHEPTFGALGGMAFLLQLRAAQKAYGVALQLAAPEPTNSARERLAAMTGTLRQYVVRVSSNVDPEVPGSDRLAEDLLRPLAAFHALHPLRAPEVMFGAVQDTMF
jgi:hypothetical protein